MKPKQVSLFLCILCLFMVLPATAQNFAESFKSLKWRAVGPANMGGRVTDIAGIPGDPNTFYVAGADGGLFMTINGGTSFEEQFINQRVYSVGAIAIAPSNKNVIWLGSGEGDPRNSVGYGNGVYRSLDGGKTWNHLGLDKTERIKRILVHPHNPDWALVCAMGKEWGPNPERGIYKTTDGGRTWKKVLYIDEDTGGSELVMDPSNPHILYAGMWTFRRKPWRFDDGGKNTAPYRSLDGGETWKKITDGLPKGPMTRIGLAVSQSQPNVVYLISEFKSGGTLFRSDNKGDSWYQVNDDPNINFRPFYYSDIRVAPDNPDHVYSLSGPLMKSTDGGKSFQRIAGGVHGDHQAMWIDPMNSNRILSGSDGGFQVSNDAGETWDIINNVELSQFYQLDIDNLNPYNIYGGLQDNGTWVGPSNSLVSAGIMKRHWKKIAGGDGYYAVPTPGKENEIYANLQGGVIFHVDIQTGNVRSIHPYPKITGSSGDAISEHKYRFNWDSPIHISPHDASTVYFGGNVLFKTSDKGMSWEEISPDLTNNDKSKQQTSGGEVYQDNTAAEFHNTILTIAESPVQEGVIWVGTDDGNVHLTQDGGQNWSNLKDNIKGLPEFAWIGKIHASEHDAGTAFIAVDQHRSDDFRPYAFKTENFGKSWTRITSSLPQDDYVKVVRQDPNYKNILYLGMEHGIYMSWNSGVSWTRINNNLPPVSVRDLRIQARENDLIVGTHGRGAWILDDIRPLQEFTQVTDKDIHMFDVRPATMWHYYSQIESMGQRTYRASNPEYGAYLNIYLSKIPEGQMEVKITNQEGKTIRTLDVKSPEAGMNRIVWDLRFEGATALERGSGSGWGSGVMRPGVSPGNYNLSLIVNGNEIQTTIVQVLSDPRFEMGQIEYRKKETFLLSLMKLESSVNTLINHSDKILEQLEGLMNKLPDNQHDELIVTIKKCYNEVHTFQNMLTMPPPAMNYRQRPELREEIRSLMRAVDGAIAVPTEPQQWRMGSLEEETNLVMQKFTEIQSGCLLKINEQAKDLPMIILEH